MLAQYDAQRLGRLNGWDNPAWNIRRGGDRAPANRLTRLRAGLQSARPQRYWRWTETGAVGAWKVKKAKVKSSQKVERAKRALAQR